MVGGHEYLVAEHRHATVDGRFRIANHAFGERARVMPDLPAAAGVHGVAFVGGGDVHDPIDHYRGNFKPFRVGDGEHPRGRQMFDVRGVDFLEIDVTVAADLAVVRRPVTRLRVNDFIEGDPLSGCAYGGRHG